MSERKNNQKTTSKYNCPYCDNNILSFVGEKYENSEVVICKKCEHKYTIKYLLKKGE